MTRELWLLPLISNLLR